MTILDLLCDSSEHDKKYTFRKSGNVYNIENVHNSIGAEIDSEGETCYFVTGCYNSGSDWVEISVDALTDMKRLCETLAEEMREK